MSQWGRNDASLVCIEPPAEALDGSVQHVVAESPLPEAPWGQTKGTTYAYMNSHEPFSVFPAGPPRGSCMSFSGPFKTIGHISLSTAHEHHWVSPTMKRPCGITCISRCAGV